MDIILFNLKGIGCRNNEAKKTNAIEEEFIHCLKSSGSGDHGQEHVLLHCLTKLRQQEGPALSPCQAFPSLKYRKIGLYDAMQWQAKMLAANLYLPF